MNVWADLRGKPLDSRRLANYLKAYGVTSANVRVGESVAKGYKRDDLLDSWSRYLGPSAIEPATSATTSPKEVEDVSHVADVAHLTDLTHEAVHCPDSRFAHTK